MSSSDPLSSKLRQLLDQAWEGKLRAQDFEQLNQLISGDVLITQQCLEQFELNAGTVRYACDSSSFDDALANHFTTDLFTKIDQQTRWSKLVRRSVAIGSAVACVAAMLFVSVWFIWTQPTAPVGQIVATSSEVEYSRPNQQAGELIRRGETLQLKSGVLSILLDSGTFISVSAPSSVMFRNQTVTRLTEGTLTAVVPPEAVGYTVLTPHAEIVDRGTEFLVKVDSELGTEVSVRRGMVETAAVDRRGEKLNRVELTAGHTARLDGQSREIREIGFDETSFNEFQHVRCGIRKLQGTARFGVAATRDFEEGRQLTMSHVLVVPESIGFTLDAPLTVNTLTGPMTLEAGVRYDSVLLHYDPPANTTAAPIGSIDFGREILAVIGQSDALAATDPFCGLNGATFADSPFRGIELPDDRCQLSPDRMKLSFHFDVSPPCNLDEVRLILKHQD
ncbi:FecR family protein [Calycomorphotria hydatis]|uniref:FecR protein n=1 Tax=Calycomorphotria hydatis TaxID=2528027 RepID=A0A517T7I2_9PLAN|nr:FecR family protein [Calycomorphotria hydatis]QDT64338.1 FecR protein [Calycomorphotria hydatis]